MSVDRVLLQRYFRQLAELGAGELYLDGLTGAQALAAVAGRPQPEAVHAPTPQSARMEAQPQPSAPERTAPPSPDTAAASRLKVLGERAAGCTSCGLHESRGSVVFGEGSPTAELLVVGEAPGQEEDRTGRPFVGRAGRLLDLLLMTAGFPRPDVYICNVLKCRPPGNRNPQPDEVAACGSFLQGQLQAVRPRVLLAAGKFAAQALLQSDETIGRLRGRVHSYGGTPLVVTYHPAYLLRSPQMTRVAWQDFQLVRRILDE